MFDIPFAYNRAVLLQLDGWSTALELEQASPAAYEMVVATNLRPVRRPVRRRTGKGYVGFVVIRVRGFSRAHHKADSEKPRLV